MILKFSSSTQSINREITVRSTPYVIDFENIMNATFFNSHNIHINFRVTSGVYHHNLYLLKTKAVNQVRLLYTMMSIFQELHISFSDRNQWVRYLYQVLKDLSSCVEFHHPDESFLTVLETPIVNNVHSYGYDQVSVIIPNRFNYVQSQFLNL